jgi:hypothetical protein
MMGNQNGSSLYGLLVQRSYVNGCEAGRLENERHIFLTPF